MVGVKEKLAEDQVRKYLLFLDDPEQLKDVKAIQAATNVVLKADDPIAKLRALAELEKVANIDPEPIEAAFVAVAKEWADRHEVPLSAFRELKVPEDVLRQAGFTLPRTNGKSNARQGGPTAGRQRAKAVPIEDIKRFVFDNLMSAPFKLSDVVGSIGGSPVTVRKAVDEMIKEGTIENLGPDPKHTGQGRAANLYGRA